MDESIYISTSAILTGFVRYAHEGNTFEDVFMFRLTIDLEVFCVIDELFSKNGRDWNCIIGFSTDVAAVVRGLRSRIAARIRTFANADLQITHCMIHRKMLASTQMIRALSDVLSDCIEVDNITEANALKNRVFKVLCVEMAAEHVNILLHTKVR